MPPRIPFIIFVVFLPLALLCAPDQAWALQSHGSPEGIFVHQFAHLFYAAALAYFFWDIGRSAFPGKGWRYLQVFCVLMIIWNVDAFTGHWVGFHIASADIVRLDGYFSSQLLGPLSSIKIIYFLATLDHLFSVPAIFFLFLGMRTLYRSSDKEDEK
jgi:predicted membrane protein